MKASRNDEGFQRDARLLAECISEGDLSEIETNDAEHELAKDYGMDAVALWDYLAELA